MLAFLAIAFAAGPTTDTKETDTVGTETKSDENKDQVERDDKAPEDGDKEEVKREVEKPAPPPPAPAPAPVAKAPPTPPPAPPVPVKPVDDDPVVFKVNGVYTAWGLTQNNFLLGKDHPLDDAAYTVQMLRIKMKFERKNYGIVSWVDGAQGWWGADNSPNVGSGLGVDELGNPIATTTYNPGAYFANKDTNYAVHLDQAYAWVKMDIGVPVTMRVGRQRYNLGHKLVLDQFLDGVQIDVQAADDVKVGLWWAKMSEGQNSMTTPTGALMSDDDVNADADLLALVADFTPGKHKIQVFGTGYWDQTGDGLSTYLPQGLGYLRSRFQPNISSLYTGGVSADLFFPDIGEGMKIQAEADVLIGSDDVDNADHFGGILDINDGSLFGWNGWFRLEQQVVKEAAFGAAFGAGSGDDDKTGGAGNVNKIQTMGFFPLTNLWEDSVMPDVAGISPQGFGSPVARGYREFENTIAVQAFTTLKPMDELKFDLSYTYFQATTPIQGFDETGTPTGDGASDIGMEIDVNGTINVMKGVSAKALTGVFLPGNAAGNLINGNTDSLEPAWEVKLVGVAAF